MSFRFFAKHFQICYVVRDAERVMARMRERHGIANWNVVPLGPEWRLKTLALAYVDDLMIELIQPDPKKSWIYDGWEPEAPDAMRLHHLGFYIHSDEEWRQAVDQLAANGYPVAASGSIPGVLDYHYSDTTADFGHYHELVRLHADGHHFFADVPHN
jgi:hypothetical protein